MFLLICLEEKAFSYQAERVKTDCCSLKRLCSRILAPSWLGKWKKSCGKGKMFRQEWELELCALFGNRNCTPQGEWKKERKFILFTKSIIYAHLDDFSLRQK